MEIRKPITIDQIELTSAILKSLGEQNPLLQAEFDFTLFNPVIKAVNDLKESLILEGDQLLKCECDKAHGHSDDCQLRGLQAYDPTEKFEEEWQNLVSTFQNLNAEQSLSFSELSDLIGEDKGRVKALISEGLSRRLFQRKKDDRFYSCFVDFDKGFKDNEVY